SQPHIEVVELRDCSDVKRIDFGGKSLSASRDLMIWGDWSGSIQMHSSVRSLTYSADSSNAYVSIGCGRSNIDPLLRVGENGLITNSLAELIAGQGNFDDLLYLCDDSAPKHVEIGLTDGLPFRHLGISGHTSIESLTIHCMDGGAQSIVIHDLPNLKTIHINGQTKLLDIDHCLSLHTVHGQGNMLRAKSFGGCGLTIGGIWTDVDSPQTIYRRSPNSQELLTCSDIAWVHIPALTYENQVMWAELFDLDISQVMEGIPLQTMIETLEDQGDDFYESIEDWTLWLINPSEQYIAMRLLTALCLRGMRKELVWKVRDNILSSNKKFYNASRGDAGIMQRFSRTKSGLKNWFDIQPFDISKSRNTRFGLGLDSWSTPSSSVLPIDRLDIEIWLETGGVGVKSNPLTTQDVINRYRTDGMSTFIDAVLQLRDPSEARNRQEDLIDNMFIHLRNSHYGNLFDQIAKMLVEYGVDKIPEVVDRFIDALLNSNVRERAMIAVAAALMQHVDDIRLQSLMTTHRSSPDIGRAEAKTLHALSLAGRRAYTQGRIPPLEWPAIENWRNIHEQ
ncbi:MAG: hypothetical protein CMA11_00470, partial [Euryarchaeota archaeon]|nr:hypothetical protein [Euryarchaeota archaeon]